MQYIFRTYAERFAPIFPFDIFKKTCRKFCVISEIWTELCQKNFVLKIHCGKPNFARQVKFVWQLKAENQTLRINVALSFKFRKYKTAFNSGLKIWLLPDFPAENPLLNGMFYYICNGLVLHLRHIFKPQNVKCNIFSELTLNASLLFFRLIF